ncbi:chalcone isomerase family protein [Marinobacter sp.]|uniref:chalcone isomerase family protein n=1 Tax=Marinobacter sp. TaxID=50741 RepID=UPI003A8ED895
MENAFLAGFASLMLAATLSAPALALTVGGVYVPDTYTANSTELQLNGAGTRSKFFIDLYVGSLYVPKAEHDGNAVVDADEPSIQSEIDQFMSVFKEEIKAGDVFDLVYVPGEGVKVFKNSEQKGTVGDLKFKKALFGIWLSDEPAQKSLKKKMLGQG